MSKPVIDIVQHLLKRLRQVQKNFGVPETDDSRMRLADAVDSMGLVEFVGILAEDFGVSPEAIDEAVGRKYGTIAEVARSLKGAGLGLTVTMPGTCQPTQGASTAGHSDKEVGMLSRPEESIKGHLRLGMGREESPSMAPRQATDILGWLVSAAARLPDKIQTAAEINDILRRPPGWLERHAGIRQRRVWTHQDPIAAACEAGRECLRRAGLTTSEVGALLVTSEALPMPVGLAAALHHQLGLGPEAVALEIGGACTGFLLAWWTATKILESVPAILILSVESHSQHLALGPGPTGEAAALFGDGAAACLICDRAVGASAIPIRAVMHSSDGSGAGLLRVERGKPDSFELRMHGVALAGRAVRAMAQSVRDLVELQEWQVDDLAAVIVHGGNGRMPNLIAMQLNLPPERLWSQTSNTGNLGSASLPVAWALQPEAPKGPVAWTAAGAGLTWAAALTGQGSTE